MLRTGISQKTHAKRGKLDTQTRVIARYFDARDMFVDTTRPDCRRYRRPVDFGGIDGKPEKSVDRVQVHGIGAREGRLPARFFHGQRDQ